MSQNNSEIPLPETVLKLIASRHHRLHHALWHGLRDMWHHESISGEMKEAIVQLGWEPPRPALRWLSGGWMPLTLNGSGVDFLYMHREMIAVFDQAMTQAGADPSVGWSVIPEPGRPESTHPGIEVPPVWGLPDGLKWLERRFSVVKSDEFYWSRMRWWDREFHDHGNLRNLTLGSLGSLLETSIHNDMHMRWSKAPIDPETGELLVLGRPDTSIDYKWDDPAYDFLGETYSSHVNPIFWRLHKWVDSIIDEWFDAHASFDQNRVQKVKVRGIDWFESAEWIEINQPWASPSPHAHHDVDTMEKVYRLLFPAVPSVDHVAGIEELPRSWFR